MWWMLLRCLAWRHRPKPLSANWINRKILFILFVAMMAVKSVCLCKNTASSFFCCSLLVVTKLFGCYWFDLGLVFVFVGVCLSVICVSDESLVKEYVGIQRRQWRMLVRWQLLQLKTNVYVCVCVCLCLRVCSITNCKMIIWFGWENRNCFDFVRFTITKHRCNGHQSLSMLAGFVWVFQMSVLTSWCCLSLAFVAPSML